VKPISGTSEHRYIASTMTPNAPDTVASAPDVQRHLDDDFVEWVGSLLHKYHVPGMSVAVVDDATVESAGYGLAQPPDVPATADTLYRMASTSKAHTAAIMGLILQDDKRNAMQRQHSSENEKITWSTPIKKILGDDLDLGNEYITQHVTLEDALSHRSSLSGHDFNYGPWLGTNYKDLTRSLRHLGPVYVPFRSKWQYCNAMFSVVGQVMEKLEGKCFDEIARERLWGPLGMHNAFLGLDSTAPACQEIRTKMQILARGYYWAKESNSKGLPEQNGGSGKGHYVCEGYDDLRLVGPAGDVVSSVNDYSKWVSALLKASSPTEQKVDAKGDEGVVVSQELWTELTTPRTIVLPSMNFFPDVNPSLDYANISPELYALGWAVGSNYMYAGQIIVHHSGGMPGFGTHVFLLPKHKFGVVIAANTQMEGNKLAEQVGRELIGRKIGIGKDERRREGNFAPKQEGSVSNMSSTNKNKEDTAEATATSIIGAPERASDVRQMSRSAIPEHFDAQSMCGMYSHGAYGQLEVNAAPISASLSSKDATLLDARIIRETSDQEQEVSGNVSDFVMHATFQGARTWKTSVLLHPPPLVAESVQTDKHKFLTLEKLWARGSLTYDSIPDLPKGHGREDDEIYPFKQEALLQSLHIIPCGACLEHISNGKKRLGMILANTESTEAAMRQGDTKNMPLEDWQMKMVWFDKVE